MREIKFRIWSVTKKRYVQDYDYYYIDNDGDLYNIDYQGYDMVKKSLKKDFYIVEQYTGLKDKNGVEIYEGDVLHCVSRWDSADMVVIFADGEFRMVLLEKGDGFYDIRCFDKEVIDNIHDNPELLT